MIEKRSFVIVLAAKKHCTQPETRHHHGRDKQHAGGSVPLFKQVGFSQRHTPRRSSSACSFTCTAADAFCGGDAEAMLFNSTLRRLDLSNNVSTGLPMP
eukprot:2493276-Rhodomonas_salina.4